jgi:hypothetical protein
MIMQHYTNHDDHSSAVEQIIDSESGIVINYKDRTVCTMHLELGAVASNLRQDKAINDIFYQRLCCHLSDEAMGDLHVSAKNTQKRMKRAANLAYITS